jgi:hypothetical protein
MIVMLTAFETLVNFEWTTRRSIPQDIHLHCCNWCPLLNRLLEQCSNLTDGVGGMGRGRAPFRATKCGEMNDITHGYEKKTKQAKSVCCGLLAL